MHTFKSFILILSLFALPILSGCGSGSNDTFDPTQQTIVTSIRSILDEVEKSGDKGSAYTALKGEIEQLRQFDSEMADKLDAEFQKMEAASKPSEIKSLATEAKKKL